MHKTWPVGVRHGIFRREILYRPFSFFEQRRLAVPLFHTKTIKIVAVLIAKHEAQAIVVVDLIVKLAL
jgi:hypothetical protein